MREKVRLLRKLRRAIMSSGRLKSASGLVNLILILRSSFLAVGCWLASLLTRVNVAELMVIWLHTPSIKLVLLIWDRYCLCFGSASAEFIWTRNLMTEKSVNFVNMLQETLSRFLRKYKLPMS
ncbi:hypothetical protein RHMOL_Rhmol01G0169000 [Rhododendron molle]|uniref:Uncharacterized protein n=1 Tax=Rhododendron molle TaxID=49168 RepID=A0ACC0Q3N4_RHOML|nr:hypothetical protein RHMOL_Rhmol01G0169000 [Rhododendron molle]